MDTQSVQIKVHERRSGSVRVRVHVLREHGLALRENHRQKEDKTGQGAQREREGERERGRERERERGGRIMRWTVLWQPYFEFNSVSVCREGKQCFRSRVCVRGTE